MCEITFFACVSPCYHLHCHFPVSSKCLYPCVRIFFKVCTSSRHVCLSKSQLWRGKWRAHLSGPILYIHRVPRCFGTCIFSLILSTTVMQRCCTHKQCCSLHYPPTRQRSALFQLKFIFLKNLISKLLTAQWEAHNVC